MTKTKSTLTKKQLLKELEGLTQTSQRALADYQNLEKRTAVEKAHFIKLANASLITKLLSVLDNLESAAHHLNDQGVNLVLTQLQDILTSAGVKPIEAQNQPFNPQTMECIDTTPGPKDQVIKVAQKGYTLNDALLRPAKVKVGSGQAKK